MLVVTAARRSVIRLNPSDPLRNSCPGRMRSFLTCVQARTTLALGSAASSPPLAGFSPRASVRVHVGNVTPTGAQDAAFFSGSLTRSDQPQRAGRHRRVVFLVNDSGQVPLLAAALQVAGTGYIVAENALMIVPSPVTGWRLTIASHSPMDSSGTSAHPSWSTQMAQPVSMRIACPPQTQCPWRWQRRLATSPTRSDRRRQPSTACGTRRGLRRRPLSLTAVARAGCDADLGHVRWLYPYRDRMDDDWDQVLKDSLIKLLDARDARAYHLAIAEMVAM